MRGCGAAPCRRTRSGFAPATGRAARPVWARKGCIVKLILLARLAPIAACLALSLAAGCAGGGGGAYGGGMGGYGGGGGGGGALDCSVAPAMGAVTIDVNLGLSSCNDTTYGLVLGYSTTADAVKSHVIKLHVGSTVVFTNTGNIAHTADDLGTSGFPVSDTVPLAQAKAGTDIGAANFSTGTLNASGMAGSTSPVYNAGVAGIYYFGCNFHYVSNGMRTVIIVS